MLIMMAMANGRFGCRDGNGEQGEEVTFQSAGKQKNSVEYREVDVRSIQYQLN